MRLQPWLSSRPARWTMTSFAVLAFLVVAPARAQVACKLLQPAEVVSALKEWSSGGKATAFAGATADSGGTFYDTCKSEIVRPGLGNLQVTVVVVKNLPMDGGQGIRIRNAALAREGGRKDKGAQFEEKTVGKSFCTRYGRPSVAAHSVCAIPRGTGYVEVEVIAPSLKETPSMDAVGGLVQKANDRL